MCYGNLPSETGALHEKSLRDKFLPIGPGEEKTEFVRHRDSFMVRRGGSPISSGDAPHLAGWPPFDLPGTPRALRGERLGKWVGQCRVGGVVPRNVSRSGEGGAFFND